MYIASLCPLFLSPAPLYFPLSCLLTVPLFLLAPAQVPQDSRKQLLRSAQIFLFHFYTIIFSINTTSTTAAQ